MKEILTTIVIILVACILSACGGSEEETPVTMEKMLFLTECTTPNPVPDEITLIKNMDIQPIKRYCRKRSDIVEATSLPTCGEQRYYSNSIIEIDPRQAALAKSIGYSVSDSKTEYYQAVECN